MGKKLINTVVSILLLTPLTFFWLGIIANLFPDLDLVISFILGYLNLDTFKNLLYLIVTPLIIGFLGLTYLQDKHSQSVVAKKFVQLLLSALGVAISLVLLLKYLFHL